MKYFTKFLPVEGEIKEGDLFIHPNNVIEKASRDLDGRGLKKVKLFLCSRDNIQEGDEVYEPSMEHLGTYKVLRDIGTNEKGLYKVIGEISPEAIWVKEGDEFEREDFDYWLYCEANPILRIKCSQCNKFH